MSIGHSPFSVRTTNYEFLVRQLFMLTVAAALSMMPPAAWSAGTSPGKNTPQRPNIIYMVMEDASPTAFGCYGAHLSTPNIDRLAAQGIQFHNAYVAATACSPSRGCFYTGMYSHRNGLIGLVNRGWELPDDCRTIVDYFNEAGYDTVLLGKFHERKLPPGWWKSFDQHPLRYQKWDAWRHVKDPDEDHTRISNVVAKAKQYLSDRKPEAPPFFMYLGTHEAHSKWESTENRKFQPPLEKIRLPEWIPDLDFVKQPYQRFLGAIHHADHVLGEFLDFLKEHQLEENTIFVFTTDHGTGMRRGKGTLYEAGIAVPLIIRWKGVSQAGRHSQALVSNIDLMPTLLEAAGIAPPKKVDGISFLPELKQEAFTGRQRIFSERNFHTNFKPIRSIRNQRYKLILNLSTAQDRPTVTELAETREWREYAMSGADRPLPLIELYDLEKDPWETTDLAKDEELKPVKERLGEELYNWMSETGDFMRGAREKVFFPAEEARIMNR